jgi:DNA-binding LytR/AlgR family response regulator
MPPETPLPENPVALIAEDEPLLAAELKEALQSLWPQLQIKALVHDGIAALHAAERDRPAIAFLDIEMPRMTGLDVARQIGRESHVVFVTAHDQHALGAFDAGAVDYVLKPIKIARLAETVERLKKRLGAAPPDLATTLAALSGLSAQAAPQRRHLQWINASQGSAVRLIMVDEVCYFKADNKYTLVATPDSESLIRKTIRELQAELDPAQFRQVHRSSLANVAAIDRVVRDGGGGMQIKFKSRPELLVVSEPYHPLFRQM